MNTERLDRLIVKRIEKCRKLIEWCLKMSGTKLNYLCTYVRYQQL